MVEGFLERIALCQPVGEAQHDVKGSPVLVGQFVAVPEQQATGTLEVAALTVAQLLLHALADVVHGLRAEADDMEAVNDDLRVACANSRR